MNFDIKVRLNSETVLVSKRNAELFLARPVAVVAYSDLEIPNTVMIVPKSNIVGYMIECDPKNNNIFLNAEVVDTYFEKLGDL
jgi:hypothetical protein